MNFRASFCDPFKKDCIEIGNISKDDILKKFEEIPWREYLTKMKNVPESEIFFSPSLEIENSDSRNGLTISAIDNDEWYIFYKRPKLVKTFFGLRTKMVDDYLSDIEVKNSYEAKKCLEALVENNLQFLEDRIKQCCIFFLAKLINRSMESLNKKSAKNFDIKNIAGYWHHSRISDEIIEEIISAGVEQVTII